MRDCRSCFASGENLPDLHQRGIKSWAAAQIREALGCEEVYIVSAIGELIPGKPRRNHPLRNCIHDLCGQLDSASSIEDLDPITAHDSSRGGIGRMDFQHAHPSV